MIWSCAVLLSALLTVVSSQMSNRSPNHADKLDIDFDGILESFREESVYLAHLNEKYIRRRATDPVTDLNSNRNFDLDLETERLEEEQRIFEYIATVTSMYDLSDEKRANIIQKLNKFPKFHEIVNKCKNVLPPPQCNPLSPYRTFDGTCNNLEHPRWGALFSCDRRLLEANYKGVSDFMQSIKGGPLPHPRTLSLHLSDDAELPTMKTSQLFPFFGQLLAHDMARNPPTTCGGRTFLCCPIQELLSLPPQCMALTYSADDPYYSQFNYTCQNMLRHVPCPSCSFEKRKHLNQATSFIDCSFAYGVNEKAAKSLRAFDGTGKLLTQPGNLMPKRVKAEKDINCRMKFKKYCFESGDSRGNQHTILASLHTLFVREHNRIATQMKILNPHWDEETLFQEARKLVNAIMQSIVYKEFLPLLLGPARMSDFDLWSKTSYYNSSVNPEQFEEFNTAAYRLHSTLNTALYENGSHSVVRLRDTFMVQQPIHEGSFGKFLKGASKFPAHKYGRHHVEDATKYLYKSPEKLFGPDIQTVNIYRGRDHGMPPYIKLLAYCTNNEVNVKTFEDLHQVMDPEEVKLLKQHYKDVADIDLIIGLQMEYNNDTSVLPPTAACINAIQFKNLKEGDRFFFTHTGLPNSFSREKIEAIYNASLSRLICDNTDVKEMQANVMLTPSEETCTRVDLFQSGPIPRYECSCDKCYDFALKEMKKRKTNPVVPCSSLPEIDLCLWKTEPATLE